MKNNKSDQGVTGKPMDQSHLNWITNFIWGIADDVLRDLYVRGKYRDVILPMVVIRRLDTLLEPTKQAVLDMKSLLDQEKIIHQDKALQKESGQAFYNTCLLYTSPSPRDRTRTRMPSSA